MIGSLRGTLVARTPPSLLVEVGGVGYELEAPLSTFYALPEVGSEVRLLTHFVVREDAQILYGFASENERQMFRSVLKVNGIGPKIGLAILSSMTVDAFALCVAAGDAAALTRIPGVGRKTAERLIVEMRDRLPQTDAGSGASGIGAALGTGATVEETEAFAALVSLGYKPAEAIGLLRGAQRDDAATAASTEELIRLALRSART